MYKRADGRIIRPDELREQVRLNRRTTQRTTLAITEYDVGKRRHGKRKRKTMERTTNLTQLCCRMENPITRTNAYDHSTNLSHRVEFLP